MAFPLPSTTFNPCSGDSQEDLRWKLMYTSKELQKVRAEGRLQKTELSRLQELLSIMIKERDEAREECRKLQECVLLQQTPAMGVDSASSFMYSSSMVSSPSSSPWSLQELEEHLNSDDFCPSVGAPTPLELQQALESLVQGCDKGQFSHSKPECTERSYALGDSHYEDQMETLNQVLCFDAPACLNSPVLSSHANDKKVSTCTPSVRSLSRQSSMNSSSASVQRYQRGQVPMESLDAMGAMSNGVGQSASAIAWASRVSKSPPSSGVGMSNFQKILPVASLAGSSVSTITSVSMPPVPTMSSSGACPIAHNATVNLSCMNNQASQPLALSAMAVSSGIVPTSSSLCHQQTISTPMRQFHLPEPPEADPQVMLNSLPEKGKLLQAVMQAGPLLQTLLLAGPLPQWRHPPPALSTRDIPKVSLVPGHVISAPASNDDLPTTLTRKRIAISESGSLNTKLKKLSTSPMKKGQAIRMVSGGSARQELAAS